MVGTGFALSKGRRSRVRSPAGLPIFIDSLGFTPIFGGPEAIINASFAQADAIADAAYDGVTAALRVNANAHPPPFYASPTCLTWFPVI